MPLSPERIEQLSRDPIYIAFVMALMFSDRAGHWPSTFDPYVHTPEERRPPVVPSPLTLENVFKLERLGGEFQSALPKDLMERWLNDFYFPSRALVRLSTLPIYPNEEGLIDIWVQFMSRHVFTTLQLDRDDFSQGIKKEMSRHVITIKGVNYGEVEIPRKTLPVQLIFSLIQQRQLRYAHIASLPLLQKADDNLVKIVAVFLLNPVIQSFIMQNENDNWEIVLQTIFSAKKPLKPELYAHKSMSLFGAVNLPRETPKVEAVVSKWLLSLS